MTKFGQRLLSACHAEGKYWRHLIEDKSEERFANSEEHRRKFNAAINSFNAKPYPPLDGDKADDRRESWQISMNRKNQTFQQGTGGSEGLRRRHCEAAPGAAWGTSGGHGGIVATEKPGEGSSEGEEVL